ncbi:MAG: DsrE family protein [Proteobacteria bacterium]|nr:DsrE family protein [Pseudomonadota bacterium]
MKLHNKIRDCLPVLFGLLLLLGCEQDHQAATAIVGPVTGQEPVISLTEPSKPMYAQTDSQFTIGNKRYLYDISEHSIEDLKLLLQRAEEITQAGTEKLEDLKIVMILHGPDIGWFTLDSYDDNKELVDLAKRLDTFDIIDLKVCETTMENMKIDRNQLPAFIESVPYAPDELNRLLNEGYTHL